MNTSAFQCSVFIGAMMVVAVYSASVTERPDIHERTLLLRQIRKASDQLLKQDLHGMVPQVYKESCAPRFFCLAHKVVEKDLTQPEFNDLRKYLKGYNKKMNTSCHLPDEMDEYPLAKFVGNVRTCANRLLN